MCHRIYPCFRDMLVTALLAKAITGAAGFLGNVATTRPATTRVQQAPPSAYQARRQGTALSATAARPFNNTQKTGMDTYSVDTCAFDPSKKQSKNLTFTADGWRTMDWTMIGRDDGDDPMLGAAASSPVKKVLIRNRWVYFKRDDQLQLPGSRVSGNKARKLWALEQVAAAAAAAARDQENTTLPPQFPQCIVSHGGPQSNAMLSLAAVTHYANTRVGDADDDPSRRLYRFVYYTKKLGRMLREQPSGNLFRAQSLGMELVQLSLHDYGTIFGSEDGELLATTPPTALSPPVPNDSMWIPQGVACRAALPGTRRLAQEVVDYWQQHGCGRPLTLLVPGGTCTTAYYLHYALRELQQRNIGGDTWDIHVVVVPCVGDESYARRQMISLCNTMDADPLDLPFILPAALERDRAGPGQRRQRYFSFGKPDPTILQTFTEFRDLHDMPIDLLYGAAAWAIVLRHLTARGIDDDEADAVDPEDGDANNALSGRRELMYVHSGGLEGVNSQLLRYKHKGLVCTSDVQLPGRARRSKHTGT